MQQFIFRLKEHWSDTETGVSIPHLDLQMHSPVTEKRVEVLQSRAMKATSPESSAVHSRIVRVYCLFIRAIIIRESSFSLSPFLVQYASSTGCSSSTQKITVSLTGTTVFLGSFLVMFPEIVKRIFNESRQINSLEKSHFCALETTTGTEFRALPRTVSSATVRLPSFISQI